MENNIDDILTENTKRSFEGPIGYLKLLPNIKYGPFYRIDRGEMANEFKKFEKELNCSKISKIELSPNVDYLIQCRRQRLVKKLDKLSIDEAERNLAKAFIYTHYEEIEMDPKFKLLAQFKLIFSNEETKKCLEKEWYKVSPSRWCGLKKPDDFMDGHEKYNLGHLFPKVYNKIQKYYLFEFNFLYESGHSNGAELFFGKTYNGNEIQYKFNNQAARCISDLKCIAIFSIAIVKKIKN